VVAAALLATLVMAAARPVAAADDEHRFATDLGFGVGAIFSNVLYMPVKFVYDARGDHRRLCVRADGPTVHRQGHLGAVDGGTYVITPSMLRKIRSISAARPAQAEASARGGDIGRRGKRDADGTAY
jgi:hypothetical protein